MGRRSADTAALPRLGPAGIHTPISSGLGLSFLVVMILFLRTVGSEALRGVCVQSPRRYQGGPAGPRVGRAILGPRCDPPAMLASQGTGEPSSTVGPRMTE